MDDGVGIFLSQGMQGILASPLHPKNEEDEDLLLTVMALTQLIRETELEGELSEALADVKKQLAVLVMRLPLASASFPEAFRKQPGRSHGLS